MGLSEPIFLMWSVKSVGSFYLQGPYSPTILKNIVFFLHDL